MVDQLIRKRHGQGNFVDVEPFGRRKICGQGGGLIEMEESLSNKPTQNWSVMGWLM